MNSSIPSSADPNHKKQPRPNSRVPSGKHRGAQPGHEHHGRKFLEPTASPILLPTPPKYFDTTKFKPTGEIVRKQFVSARLVVDVQEFQAIEYRNLETGQRVHADFPYGLTDDVTYDGSVKALAYMLNNYCYTSIGKTRQFLLEASEGKLALSTGFICELSEKFSKLSKEEQDAAWNALAASPVFHVDFTFGRCDGSTTTVAIVCDDDGNVVFQAKEKKGKEGIKGTPAEVNQGVCVSDHERALVTLGSSHQECLGHTGRYSIGSIQNEPHLTWNKLASSVHFDIIEYRTNMKPDEELDPVKVDELERRFYEMLERGKIEYEENPPSKETVVSELKIMSDALEAQYGAKPMIYAQRDLYDLYLKGNFDENPRWVRSIYFPARWENGDNWLIWQYKDRGELQGYSGGEKYIDLDVLNPHKTLDDIRIK